MLIIIAFSGLADRLKSSKKCDRQLFPQQIDGMRIRVSDILETLADNVPASEILADFPDLELEDIQACLLFAAR